MSAEYLLAGDPIEPVEQVLYDDAETDKLLILLRSKGRVLTRQDFYDKPNGSDDLNQTSAVNNFLAKVVCDPWTADRLHLEDEGSNLKIWWGEPVEQIEEASLSTAPANESSVLGEVDCDTIFYPSTVYSVLPVAPPASSGHSSPRRPAQTVWRPLSTGPTPRVVERQALPISEASQTGVLGVLGALATDSKTETWQESALCAETDPEAFFPEKGGSTREAKKICTLCEVKAACLKYALDNDERFGIWGGLSERERRRLQRRTV